MIAWAIVALATAFLCFVMSIVVERREATDTGFAFMLAGFLLALLGFLLIIADAFSR